MFFLIIISCQSTSLTPDLEILKKIEENPELASSLCALLSDENTKQRCTTISLRPHLWANPKSIQTIKSNRKKGPSAKHILPKISITTPSYLPSTHECPDIQCWEEEAKEKKELELIKNTCKHINNENWRSECMFIVAEDHLPKLGYAHSAELCLNSGDFAANCFMHLSYALAEKTPPAISDLKYEWQEINESAQSIKTFWKEKDFLFGEAMTQQFWAKSLDISYTKAGIVAGNPFDYLPKEATPHIHAAASMHLMLMEGAESYPLEEWAYRTKRALNARLPQSAIRPQRTYMRQKAKNPWPSDTRDEETIPATYYMTDGRRTSSSITHIDLLITTIEAAARCKKGQKVVNEGQNHEHPLVRWTAFRLSKE
jgi:hypothetical protein